MPKTAAAQAGTKRKGEGQERDESKRTRRPENRKVINYIEKFIDRVENGQDHEEDLESRLQIGKSEIADKESQNRVLREQIAELKKLLNTSRRRSDQLFEEKEDLKMDLMKQQPMSQLSDAEIADMYDGLQRNISSWVDGEVAAFETEWKETYQLKEMPQDLDIFSNTAAQEESEILAAGYHYAREESEFLAAGYCYGGEYLIESLIHAHLHEALFKDGMTFFALNGQETMFLHTAVRELVQGKPPRDAATIRYLVSELLKGFASSATFFERRHNLASKMEIELLADVEKTLPKLRDRLGRVERLRHRVIVPALDLAVALRTSATHYTFSCRMTPEVQFVQEDIAGLDSSTCVMIDVDTRQTVQAGKKSFLGANTRRVLLLSPALQRKDSDRPAKYLTPDRVCVQIGVLPLVIAPAALDCAATGQSPAKSKIDKFGLIKVESSQQATDGEPTKEAANGNTDGMPAVDIKIEVATQATSPWAASLGATSFGADLTDAADLEAERHDVPQLGKSYDLRSRKE